jgi:hypothetical protein
MHRLVDLGFPEFTPYLKDLITALATAILQQYPTAQAFRGLSRKRLAKLTYDGRHQVGTELAKQLIDAAAISVGSNIALATGSGCATPARISRFYLSGLSGWTETLRARYSGIKLVGS